MNEIETVFVERDKFWSAGAWEVPEKTLFIYKKLYFVFLHVLLLNFEFAEF